MKRLIPIAAVPVMAQFAFARELADLFEANKHSLVTIYNSEQENTGAGDPPTFTSNPGLGSGFLICDNMVVTAAHEVAIAEEIMVEFFDGEKIEEEKVFEFFQTGRSWSLTGSLPTTEPALLCLQSIPGS